MVPSVTGDHHCHIAGAVRPSAQNALTSNNSLLQHRLLRGQFDKGSLSRPR